MPKKIDLTGKNFGEWTVIREATKEEKENRPGCYWKCKCSCGLEKIVNGQTLRKGESKSCGCQLSKNLSNSLKNKNCIDITGQRFGRLVVLERNYEAEKSHNNNTYWNCKCDCGKITCVVKSSLIQGQTKSCGCLRREKAAEHLFNIAKNNYIDEIGNKYGKLTVIQKTTNNVGQLRWKCQCDCGRTIEVSSNSLRSGNTQSCGCLGKSKGEWKIEQLLENNNILFTKEYPVFIDNKRLRFDFAIFKNNKLEYFIEFDGKQHYEPIEYFGGQKYFEYIHNNDIIKTQWCKDNNIPLIRIPYTKYETLCIEDLLLQEPAKVILD